MRLPVSEKQDGYMSFTAEQVSAAILWAFLQTGLTDSNAMIVSLKVLKIGERLPETQVNLNKAREDYAKELNEEGDAE